MSGDTMQDCLDALRKHADEADTPERKYWRHRIADDYEKLMSDPEAQKTHRLLGGI